MDVSKAFALLYILAQAVERIVELISDFGIWGDPKSPDPVVLHHRAIRLWLVSSVVGILACVVYNVNFFTMIDPSKANFPISALDAILSGIIVGSGTKPVHDVITSIEKYSRKP
jgi:hypothetical protein